MKNLTVRRFGGFTLIELLVVVLIIGILASVALPQYEKAVMKSRSVQGITLVKSLADAQKVYFMANGLYASRLEDLDISLPGNPSGTSATVGDFTVKLERPDDLSLTHVQASYVKNNQLLWHIVFYMAPGQLYCVSCGNTEGDKFCKTFNSSSQPCPETTCNCYAIK